MTGQQLRTIRKRLKLTQAQFAERVGVTANTVARWERDEVTITEPTARLIQLIAQPAMRPDRDGRSAVRSKRTRAVKVDRKHVPRRGKRGTGR